MRKGLREACLGSACRLLGFANLRGSAETALAGSSVTVQLPRATPSVSL